MQAAARYAVSRDVRSKIQCFRAKEVLIPTTVVNQVAACRSATQGSYHLLRDVWVVEEYRWTGLPTQLLEARDVGPRQHHGVAAEVSQRAQHQIAFELLCDDR